MEYLWDKDIISRHHYSKTSFFMNGDCSPKLTAWTAIGAISPRRVFLEILKYENKNGSSEQTECVKREMLWKDYFVFWALKHHKVYFDAEYGIYNRSHYEWQTDPEIIKRVKEGKTGMPIIDALVRDFNESGNMSYKAKMIFAITFQVTSDKIGGREPNFLRRGCLTMNHVRLLESDIKVQVLVQAGSLNHDPKGEYIKAFVEELRYVPEEYVHDPWRMPIYLQKESSCVLGKDYPKPIPCLRYTKETKGSNVDRTKTSKKGSKILFDNTQSSLLTFIQVTKEKEKYMQQKELEKAKSSKPLRDITEVDKENIEKSS
ncbi:unnamed protein product [Moneuplotes crassus]|uniref:Cryptochrome/DNA photolyase FAD-binding domain-containing protein n=1 Tax=Euplotes crassus TaxID=5936 RepID=A0AAD1Y6F8_EUPCR|nr:unnamed protein product [Moneuplotes crassus]